MNVRLQTPIGPVELRTEVGTATDDAGHKWVVLSCFTPTGVQMYFLDESHARFVAEQLTAEVSGSKLAVPPGAAEAFLRQLPPVPPRNGERR